MQWQYWAMMAHHYHLILSFRLKMHLKVFQFKSNLIYEMIHQLRQQMKNKMQVKTGINLVSDINLKCKL